MTRLYASCTVSFAARKRFTATFALRLAAFHSLYSCCSVLRRAASVSPGVRSARAERTSYSCFANAASARSSRSAGACASWKALAAASYVCTRGKT